MLTNWPSESRLFRGKQKLVSINEACRDGESISLVFVHLYDSRATIVTVGGKQKRVPLAGEARPGQARPAQLGPARAHCAREGTMALDWWAECAQKTMRDSCAAESRSHAHIIGDILRSCG